MEVVELEIRLQIIFVFLITVLFIFALVLLSFSLFKYSGFLLKARESKNYFCKAINFIAFKPLSNEITFKRLFSFSFLLSLVLFCGLGLLSYINHSFV